MIQKFDEYIKSKTWRDIEKELVTISVNYFDFDGKEKTGEIICNKSIKKDLEEIFEKLHQEKYQIFNISPISEFGNDDKLSMASNNTYCYCKRIVANSNRLSKHGMGLAIDINPVNNPCLYIGEDGNIDRVCPNTKEARDNIDRRMSSEHQINKSSIVYKLFKEHGFRWGGEFKNKKDYHHFEKITEEK